jgi:hypothetical protein
MLLKDLQNLKKIALHNVKSETVARFIETCYRYYSRTYHTPLKKVYEELTPQEVALYYFEDMMEGLSPEQLQEHQEELYNKWLPVLSGDIKKLKSEQEALDDESWIAMQNEMLRKQEAAKKAKAEAELVAKTDEFVKNFSDKLNKIGEIINQEDKKSEE